MYQLRDYQQAAVSSATRHMRNTGESALIVAPTGSGKSLMVAALAHNFGTALALQPAKELVAQNAAKYAAIDTGYSICCAGLGKQDISGDVIFASHQSVAKFLHKLPEIKLLIVDEAHKFLESTKDTIALLKSRFPDMVVCALTATPYIMGRSVIYRIDVDGNEVKLPIDFSEDFDKNDPQAPPPYDPSKDVRLYDRCVYEVDPDILIERGYLVQPVVGVPSTSYNTLKLKLAANGKFSNASLDAALTDDATTTRAICTEVYALLESGRRKAVMMFCATLRHAAEVRGTLVRAGLDERRIRVITGNTPGAVRDRALKAFRLGMIDVLVNVAVLTTGVDLPVCDTIAILRPTESVSLWQQIVGRGLRPSEGKDDCWILDYTDNIPRFFYKGETEDFYQLDASTQADLLSKVDVFRPHVLGRSARMAKLTEIDCPLCKTAQPAVLKKFPGIGYQPVNRDGFVVDLAGDLLDVDGPVIGHYSRRCKHVHEDGRRCEHRFVSKECEKCGTENDVAARECRGCGTVLVDWNAKLKEDATRIKKGQKDAQKAEEEALRREAQELLRQASFLGSKPARGGEWQLWKVSGMSERTSKHSSAISVWSFRVQGLDKPFNKVIPPDSAMGLALSRGRVPVAVAVRPQFSKPEYNDVRVFMTPDEYEDFSC